MPRKLLNIYENIANPLYTCYITLVWEGTKYDTDPELTRRIEFPMVFHINLLKLS